MRQVIAASTQIPTAPTTQPTTIQTVSLSSDSCSCSVVVAAIVVVVGPAVVVKLKSLLDTLLLLLVHRYGYSFEKKPRKHFRMRSELIWSGFVSEVVGHRMLSAEMNLFKMTRRCSVTGVVVHKWLTVANTRWSAELCGKRSVHWALSVCLGQLKKISAQWCVQKTIYLRWTGVEIIVPSDKRAVI